MKSIIVALVALVATCAAQNAKPIYQSSQFTLFPDRVVEGSYSSRANSAVELDSIYPREDSSQPRPRWTLQADLAKYPRFHSSAPIMDAVYNLSLEELTKDIRPDGAFMAGAKWEGVWTRDISFSILLSLAAIEPDVARRSLMQKVKHGRIVQDTGTGGSWPVSSDRMTWALAAWEIYKVTGDRQWLHQSYEIIRASAEDDAHAVISSQNGLAFGESSFLDWREQTYPRWMEPADIYSSQALGTNVVHYQTYRILARMAKLLGDSGDSYTQRADRIRASMNQLLWSQSNGYYGQYLYGRQFPSLSQRPEMLGESLAILFDIPSPAQRRRMMSSLPLLDYGVPCIYPQTPGIPPYHNQAIWPFVQAFWNLAAARANDGPALTQGIALMVRQAALFQTNKENMVASTGNPFGTQINSDRQLWSVAGNLSMVYRVLFGISFEEDGLHFNPVIPSELSGVRTLENLRYRKAVLSVRVQGSGSRVRSIRLDGAPLTGALPPTVAGNHRIEIVMAEDKLASAPLHLVSNATAPETPKTSLEAGKLSWTPVDHSNTYRVYRDGKLLLQQSQTVLSLPAIPGYHEYQVSAADAQGLESFLSEPIATGAEIGRVIAALSENPATNPPTPLELTRERNIRVEIRASVPEAGQYRAQLHYANGSGPINTDNKCAVRSLYVDGKPAGVLVMPQRGSERWSDWGLSSALPVSLSAGEHRFEIRFESHNENMNPDVNRALVDSLIFILASKPTSLQSRVH